MTEEKIDSISSKLLNIVITDHITNNLGKVSLKEYILNKITLEDDLDFIKIVFKLGNLLADNGYEIKLDIDKFEIVNYTNEEYNNYLREIKKLDLKNKDKLLNKSQELTNDLINISKEETLSLKDSLKYLFKDMKLSQKEEIFLRVHIINNLTNKGYKIDNINPLKLKKI